MKQRGYTLVPGIGTGYVLWTDTPISFYGGVDSKTGEVIDRHHPLCGQNIKDKILVIPGGRGSCAGSGGILELLHAGCAPAALVFGQPEVLVTLGVWVSRAMFNKSIPVLVLGTSLFSDLQYHSHASISERNVTFGDAALCLSLEPYAHFPPTPITLSPNDKDILDGKKGEAKKQAMEIIMLYSQAQGADGLIDVSQAHIDACVYVGPTSLLIPQRLLALGAEVAVPTTMNSLNVDRRRWKELGCEPILSDAASEVGDIYMKIGAKESFTCAPYLLGTAPGPGDQIGWAESNAVVYANSVLGARTQKYPDYLDVMIAITGRAPNANCHTDSGRVPTLRIDFPELDEFDDSLYPLLGYFVGQRVGAEIPLILGLDNITPLPGIPELKAFSAAFATTSAAPMFHMKGVTPEAHKHEHLLSELKPVPITFSDLRACWGKLNTHVDSSVALTSLGNPHFALDEFAALAKLTRGRKRSPATQMIITTSREVYEKAAEAGYIASLEAFGATFITDTCWCLIEEPVIPLDSKNLMTNSAKYAHYGPGMTKRGIHFGSLAACVDATECGYNKQGTPTWLRGGSPPWV